MTVCPRPLRLAMMSPLRREAMASVLLQLGEAPEHA